MIKHAVTHTVLLTDLAVLCTGLAVFLAVFRTDLGSVPKTAFLAVLLTKQMLGTIKNPFEFISHFRDMFEPFWMSSRIKKVDERVSVGVDVG